MIFEIFSQDSFRVTVPVTRAGAAFPLTGATVAAVATNGVTAVAGTVDMTDAAQGNIGVIFPAGSLAAGNWQFQVRVSIYGETQTVARASIRVAQAAVAA